MTVPLQGGTDIMLNHNYVGIQTVTFMVQHKKQPVTCVLL